MTRQQATRNYGSVCGPAIQPMRLFGACERGQSSVWPQVLQRNFGVDRNCAKGLETLTAELVE